MYQPRPPFEPATPKTISAPTTVRQAKAQARRRPARIWGRAAGRKTSRTVCVRLKPRLRATIRVVVPIVRKPVSVLAEIGQIEPKTTTKIIADELKPNQSIVKGKIAIPGIGLNTAVSTVNR